MLGSHGPVRCGAGPEHRVPVAARPWVSSEVPGLPLQALRGFEQAPGRGWPSREDGATGASPARPGGRSELVGPWRPGWCSVPCSGSAGGACCSLGAKAHPPPQEHDGEYADRLWVATRPAARRAVAQALQGSPRAVGLGAACPFACLCSLETAGGRGAGCVLGAAAPPGAAWVCAGPAAVRAWAGARPSAGAALLSDLGDARAPAVPPQLLTPRVPPAVPLRLGRLSGPPTLRSACAVCRHRQALGPQGRPPVAGPRPACWVGDTRQDPVGENRPLPLPPWTGLPPSLLPALASARKAMYLFALGKPHGLRAGPAPEPAHSWRGQGLPEPHLGAEWRALPFSWFGFFFFSFLGCVSRDAHSSL